MRIVDYSPTYKSAFKTLNEAWINQYFSIEASDQKILDNPDSYVIDRGGHILIAILDDQPVGTVALVPMEDPNYDFELAKMCVDPSAQGQGIGRALGQAALDHAVKVGASRVYLETNSILKTAIHVYKKLGFVPDKGYCSPYRRCDVQMVWEATDITD